MGTTRLALYRSDCYTLVLLDSGHYGSLCAMSTYCTGVSGYISDIPEYPSNISFTITSNLKTNKFFPKII